MNGVDFITLIYLFILFSGPPPPSYAHANPNETAKVHEVWFDFEGDPFQCWYADTNDFS